MVFKMLILLGFFIDQGGLFIHSDIHRSAVNRVDYAVQIAPNRRLGLPQDATEICMERVKPLSFAEASGGYDAFYKKFNETVSAAAGR